MSVSDIGYVKIVLTTSAENCYKLKFRNFFRTYLHVLFVNPISNVLDASGLFFDSMTNVISNIL